MAPAYIVLDNEFHSNKWKDLIDIRLQVLNGSLHIQSFKLKV